MGGSASTVSRITTNLAQYEGRYTGAVELYCYGPEKARILADIAERDGIDLAASYAYSDSATDVPMLAAVGHPVAVNPDRELVRAARANEWEIVNFSNRVPLRERVAEAEGWPARLHPFRRGGHWVAIGESPVGDRGESLGGFVGA